MPNKWDIAKVKKFVEENSECELLSTEYQNTKSKLLFKCKCGNVFETSFKEFKGRKDRNYAKRQCNECGLRLRVKKRTKPHSQFVDEVYKLVKDEYSVIGEYINALTPIQLKHNKCGNIFNMAPNDFLKGQRCPSCYGTPKKTTNQFKKEVKHLYGNEYIVLSQYKGNKEKIKMKHNLCGYIWETTPNTFLKGTLCPKCAVISKGELKIRRYLRKHNIDFKEQFIIDKCRYKKPLPFDFAIFKNNKLEFLIEYNGEQHFKPMRFKNAKKKFKETIRNDKIKREYCKNNNIKLIEIPYTQFKNIEEILSNVL